MNKILLILCVFLLTNAQIFAEEIQDKSRNLALSNINFSEIGFHKKSDVSDVIQIKDIFNKYVKYTNSKDLNAFLSLHSDEYYSNDGYDKSKLSTFAQDSWKEFPKVQSTLKIISIDVCLDNATVIAKETLSGYTNSSVANIKGVGFIDAESTTVYYLKKYSNDWKITSDYVISEKSALRYGVAKFIPMQLDAPSIQAPNSEYTAILKINLPSKYLALVSINNEAITQSHENNDEIFRSIKDTGVRERVLTSNDGSKNENAVASVGIVQSDVIDDNINIEIVGMAFLSSRVNIIKHKYDINKLDNSNNIKK